MRQKVNGTNTEKNILVKNYTSQGTKLLKAIYKKVNLKTLE